MRIYRVQLGSFQEGIAGYEYFTSKIEASKRLRKALSEGEDWSELQQGDFPISKAGIINALNTWGEHAENG